ncbi:MAG: hypothetical protein JNJ49_12015 [Bdellovibrionaceae bacterium]|nr:hypothetical protein [Pseudobdellovibrionaceae bacterium]
MTGRPMLTGLVASMSMLISISSWANDSIEIPKCIDAGQLVELGDATQSDTSADGRYIKTVGQFADSALHVFDTKTNTKRSFERKPNSFTEFISNHEIAYVDVPDDIAGNLNMSAEEAIKSVDRVSTVIIDLQTGTRRVEKGFTLLQGELARPVGKSGDDLVKFRTSSGREIHAKVGNKTPNRHLSPETKKTPEVLYDESSGQMTIRKDSRTIFEGISRLGKPARGWFNVGFPAGNRYLVSERADQQLYVLDVRTGKEQIIKLPENYGPPYSFQWAANSRNASIFSPDGTNMMLMPRQSPNEGLKTINLRTGNITTRKNLQTLSPVFDASGNICIIDNTATKLSKACFSPTLGTEVSRHTYPSGLSISTEVSTNSAVLSRWDRDGSGSSFFFSTQKICPKLTQVSPDRCESGQPSTLPLIPEIKKMALATACSKSFDARDWDNLPKKNLDELDASESLIVLRRFSKPSGFNADQHTGVLLGMIKSGLHKSQPAAFRAAMLGVLHSSNRLYESILGLVPDLMEGPTAADQQCLTKEERESINKALWSHAKARLALDPTPSFKEIGTLLRSLKHELTNAQKETLAEAAADRLVISAGDSESLNQVFSSKVYKFAESKTREALGLPFHDLTDVTVIREKSRLRVLQIGTNAFEGSTRTLAGFHIKEVKDIDVSGLPVGTSKETVTWRYGTDAANYSADLELNREKLEHSLVPVAPAPNYTEMWKKKNFRGVIIAGSNLGKGLTDTVVKNYVEYFTQQGFNFSDPVPNQNLATYLESKVSGSEPMHYFVKEAHSDGDEKNLFRTSKTGRVLKGVRKDPRGVETIEIVFPDDSKETELISNQDFGRWMKGRDKAKMPELIYLNSSCWSKTKAIYEISAAATPKLINIPTSTSMVVFNNTDKNAMYAAVHGVRNGKTYEEIRTAMKADAGNASGKKNVFIFPDEESYRTNVTDVLRIPVDVKTKITKTQPGGKPIPYSIESVHD